MTTVANSISFTCTGASGLQTTVSLSGHYTKPPIVVLTPSNVNAAVNNMGYYVTSTTRSFSINAAFTGAKAVYDFNYIVMASS